jgi:hypothetical protein
VGSDEGVLHGILGLLLRTEHVTTERKDAAVMAIIDLLKRTDAPGAQLINQALVTNRPQHTARQNQARPTTNIHKTSINASQHDALLCGPS